MHSDEYTVYGYIPTSTYASRPRIALRYGRLRLTTGLYGGTYLCSHIRYSLLVSDRRVTVINIIQSSGSIPLSSRLT